MKFPALCAFIRHRGAIKTEIATVSLGVVNEPRRRLTIWRCECGVRFVTEQKEIA